MPRILIFGERGQVASALARTYAAKSVTFRCIGRATTDIGDRPGVLAAVTGFAPGLIVNAAAYTAGDKAEDDAGRAFLVNRDGAPRSAGAGCRAGVPILAILT